MFKRSDPTDIWAWTNKDADRLLQIGGPQQAIIENYQDFLQHYTDNDYVSAELAISQALEAARETNEIKWQLHLRHWRLQLWLKQRETRRALPEAVDLLSLATDRRVRDVPQRICAFHDIVECYVQIDPAGYHEEIVANAQDVLAQLPKRHPCATCARSNLAHTTAAIGNTKDSEHWMNQVKATMTDRFPNFLTINFGTNCSLLGNWDEAERYLQQAQNVAQTEKKRADFIHATLPLIRVYLEKGELPKALDMLQVARQNMKFQGHTYDMAQLAEMEGRIAATLQHPESALDHMTRATRLYLDLGCYRDAALLALYAADVAQEARLESLTAILDLAAQAVGQLPPTSPDVHQKLAAFGRQPITPAADTQTQTITTAAEQDQKELHTLQELLQEHVTHKNYANVTMTLYRLAIWHGDHNQMRAAIDYLVADAALERLMQLPFEDREAAIETLGRLRKNLPDSTVESALAAAQNGPASWIQPLFPDMSLLYWRWILRGIETEMDERPFVEPEPLPTAQEANDNFNEWLNYSASMATLIVRFYPQCDPQEFLSWAEAMDETATDIINGSKDAPDPETQVTPIINLVRGFASLARGIPLQQVLATMKPPFIDMLTEIAEVAKSPVWFHPGASPIDFLIEQAAQRAVRTLRRHDEERSRRLKNLALRYKLMTIDLRTVEQLAPIANFLDALRTLVLLDGKELPTLEQPLEKPFDAVLNAVFESSQLSEPERGD